MRYASYWERRKPASAGAMLDQLHTARGLTLKCPLGDHSGILLRGNLRMPLKKRIPKVETAHQRSD